MTNKEKMTMRKQNVGIAMLLMGLIVAQYAELAAWMFGMMLGVAGLMVTLYGMKEE